MRGEAYCCFFSPRTSKRPKRRWRKKRGSCKKVKQTVAVGGPWEGEEGAGEDFFCDHPSVSPVSTRVASPLLYTPSFRAKFAKAGIDRGVIVASK